MTTLITCDDLDATIDHLIQTKGYRLDMIVPADSPTAALLSKDDDKIRLELSSKSESSPNLELRTLNFELTSDSEWVTGRAGMEYRDLIPGRLDGKVIASHIRLTKGGDVADYVHYHKVAFQMIFCKHGRIRVVYEDQGPPFWLETGDCVLQPPEIRHRVLECTANAEVIEISMPAEHETWVDHDMTLPTSKLKPDRIFGSQRFIRKIGSKSRGAEDEFGKTLLKITALLPSSESIDTVIHSIIPMIHQYLGKNPPHKVNS